MTDTQREFMTTWHTSPRPYMASWSTRNKSNTMESATSTDFVPYFRPFDLLAMPNQALTLFENTDQRIGVESVCGAQSHFVRHVDFDTVYVQFAGTTTLETEYGEFVMKPGELMLIPEGIAHRSTGSADSLRWFAFVVDPFTEIMDANKHTGETEFRVTRHNGPDWLIPAGKEQPVKSGFVEERMICWDHDAASATIAKRDYDYLVGGTSAHISEKQCAIRLIRIFDIFTFVAGKAGGVPPILQSKHCRMETFNTSGEQFAYHRALRSEELRFQFRGDAYDLSELENVRITPGGVTLIPRGISHGLITDPPNSPAFLRYNILSDLRWHYPHDLTRHLFNSTFETQTLVRQEAPWRVEAGLVVPSLAAANA